MPGRLVSEEDVRPEPGPDSPKRVPGSANGAAEANHVAVGIGDGALPCSVVLVPGAIHLDPGPYPLSSHPIRLLTVEVERTVPRRFALRGLGKVDREVTFPVSEGIRIVVGAHLEARPLEPGERASDIGDLENRLETPDQPRSCHELPLAVALPIESGEAVVANRQVRV